MWIFFCFCFIRFIRVLLLWSARCLAVQRFFHCLHVHFLTFERMQNGNCIHYVSNSCHELDQLISKLLAAEDVPLLLTAVDKPFEKMFRHYANQTSFDCRIKSRKSFSFSRLLWFSERAGCSVLDEFRTLDAVFSGLILRSQSVSITVSIFYHD